MISGTVDLPSCEPHIACRSSTAAVGPSSVASGHVLAVIPTYNESANIVRIVEAVLASQPGIEVLVVDDDSPDGTGGKAEQLARRDRRVHVLHRKSKRGLGAAYMAGFRWALRRSYRLIVQMDADFSHDPAAIPQLLKHAERYDLVVGSRYCNGGRTVGWPKGRQWLSFAANVYARTLLGSRIRDLTGGFRCWRREILERIDFASLRCNGYAFQVEMGHLAELAGARIVETPIAFTERSEGKSKMSGEIAREAARQTALLAWDRIWSRRHKALLADSRHPPDPSESLKRRTSAEPRRVLVMCLGGIGDAVLSFAMLRELRRRLPKAHLTALAMWPQAAELIEDLGIFDEVRQHNFQNDRWWGSLAELARLNSRRFDLSILTFPTHRWEFRLASWLIHARKRLGHRYLDDASPLSLRLLTHAVAQAPRAHTIDENLKLLRRVPLSVRAAASEPDIRLGLLAPQYLAHGEQVLATIPGPYLGIHAGSSTAKQMDAKRWPAEYFAELCRLAHERLGLTPLLFGAGAEMLLNQYIAGRTPAARVVRPISIRHDAAVIKRCAAFVSNDSALAHLASALDVPTVMIVGPTDPDMIASYHGRGTVVRSSLACAPCFRPRPRPLACTQACPFECLRGIQPEQVLQAVSEQLNRPKHPANGGLLRVVVPMEASRLLVGRWTGHRRSTNEVGCSEGAGNFGDTDPGFSAQDRAGVVQSTSLLNGGRTRHDAQEQ